MLSYGFYCTDSDYCSYHYTKYYNNARAAVNAAIAHKDCEDLVCYGIVGKESGIDGAVHVWSR